MVFQLQRERKVRGYQGRELYYQEERLNLISAVSILIIRVFSTRLSSSSPSKELLISCNDTVTTFLSSAVFHKDVELVSVPLVLLTDQGKTIIFVFLYHAMLSFCSWSSSSGSDWALLLHMVADNGDGPESADCFPRTLRLMLGFLGCLGNNDAHEASSVIRTTGSLRPAPTVYALIHMHEHLHAWWSESRKTFRGLLEHVGAGQPVTRI